MRWFFNDGGPLIVLPETATTAWEGSDVPSEGRVVSAESRAVGDVATDYDRAGDLFTPAVLDVGASWGAVLPTDTGWAGWLPSAAPHRFYFVGIIAADDDDPAMLTALAEDPNHVWELLATAVECGNAGLLLTHAASTADEINEHPNDEPGSSYIGDGIRVRVPPGRYRVDWCMVEDDVVDARFLRFTSS